MHDSATTTPSASVVVTTPNYAWVLRDGKPAAVALRSDREVAERLAVDLNKNGDPIVGEVVFTFSYLGHYIEIVERPRTSFPRFSSYITPPGGKRFKTAINLHMRESAVEDAMKDVERRIQDERNRDPQFALPPSSEDFEAARLEAERAEFDKNNVPEPFDGLG